MQVKLTIAVCIIASMIPNAYSIKLANTSNCNMVEYPPPIQEVPLNFTSDNLLALVNIDAYFQHMPYLNQQAPNGERLIKPLNLTSISYSTHRFYTLRLNFDCAILDVEVEISDSGDSIEVNSIDVKFSQTPGGDDFVHFCRAHVNDIKFDSSKHLVCHDTLKFECRKIASHVGRKYKTIAWLYIRRFELEIGVETRRDHSMGKFALPEVECSHQSIE